MKKEWLTMPTFTKGNAFSIPNLHMASSLLLKELKLVQMIETNRTEIIFEIFICRGDGKSRD